jgi:bifunctional non-homologous end joining protein LigD
MPNPIHNVFDVLYLDGMDITRRPYVQRRALLEDLQLHAPPIITSPRWDGADISAEAMFDVVRELSLEGFVIKRASSTYQAGRRSTAWTKAVVRHRSPMVVCGFIPGRGRHTGGVGTLLVGAHNDAGELVYCGHVGPGAHRPHARRSRRAAGRTTLRRIAFHYANAGRRRPGRMGNTHARRRRRIPADFTGRIRHPSLKGLADVDAGLVRLPPIT